MSVHLEIAIHRLKKILVGLAATTEEQVRDSVQAFHSRDEERAKSVIAKDTVVDQMELDIEEECLQTLALYQPVAFDLRFVVAVLKINNDLERIGDVAVNIAERAVSLCERNAPRETLNFDEMERLTFEMLKGCIDAFIASDIERARQIWEMDSFVDELHAANYRRLDELMAKYPEEASVLIQHLSLSRYLERISDLATNVAEDVIYLVEGKIVRHRVARERRPKA